MIKLPCRVAAALDQAIYEIISAWWFRTRSKYTVMESKNQLENSEMDTPKRVMICPKYSDTNISS